MRNSKKKGFSLVELIVVVAIMAVLVAVLAPTLTKYVEKSRTQKDESAVAELVNAANLAIADEDIYDVIVNGLKVTFTISNKTITISTGTASVDSGTAPDVSKLLTELTEDVGDIKLSSKTHSGKPSYILSFTVNEGKITATGAWGTTT